MTAKTKKPAVKVDALVDDLRHLRTMSREAAQSFILRHEADIETVITCLSGLSARTVRRKAEEWKTLLGGLRLKPEKGRLKDLKALHETLRRLLEDVLEASETKPPRKMVVRKRTKPALEAAAASGPSSGAAV